ncbi:IS5 family transposase [Agrobacterium vitis]|uniref:IS5 family transposase n=1 Tax=Agrobacterium vitis TaxID=373 RepID=A0A6L6VLW0_AGRVI|nr:IS5 family transposase [Agrobacterium vitis]MUZ76021.1 IS5 family transposase [Agrobacterium vitis]
MPHKFNSARRHKIARQKHRLMNWAAYNESLRRRGDLTVWVSEEVQCLWSASRRMSRGGQQKYSDLAITLCLTLRVVYDLPLRQTQGLMRSVADLMGLDVMVPDFSTLSRRSKGLVLPPGRHRSGNQGPVHLVVDSTGLKIVGAGEWLETKHCAKPMRKRWRKLHLGLDLVSGDILCAELTPDEIGDPTALPDLLDQIETPVDRFIADGAYDGLQTRDLLAARFGDHADVIIPPPKNAVASPDATAHPTVRDRHIAQIAQKGRMAWQASTGYNQRSRAETQMGRWKTVIGPKQRAKTFDNQKTQARIGVRVLNRMTALGRPVFERTA